MPVVHEKALLVENIAEVKKLLLGKFSLFLFLKKRSRAEKNWNLNFWLETEEYLKNNWFRSTGRRDDRNWIQVYPASASAIGQVSWSHLPRHSTNSAPFNTTEHHGKSVSKQLLTDQSRINGSHRGINTMVKLLVSKKVKFGPEQKAWFQLACYLLLSTELKWPDFQRSWLG